MSSPVMARTPGQAPAPASTPVQLVGLLAACTVSAATAVLLGGGPALWLALPIALAVAAFAERPALGAPGAGAVLMAALTPSLASASVAPPASPLPGLVAAVASVVVVLALRRRAEVEARGLRVSALSDPLTGVANRRALMQRVDYEVARHSRAQRGFAVLALDLDGFKALNDRFGHPAGDELLCDVAAALRHAVREQDTVARTGGDEFCVLAPETDAAGAQRLASRIEAAVGRVTAGLDTLSASVGLARFPEDGAGASAVLEVADANLLAHKRSRRAPDGRTRRAA